jgi:hypothetical protein
LEKGVTTVVITDLGLNRLERQFKAWKDLERVFNIPIPDSEGYHP